MVTTNEQDGASRSSPPTPSQPEQQPSEAVNSNHINHTPPPPEESEDSGNEAAGPLRHPAPPPDEPPAPYTDENWKRPPPRLMIKIYQVPVGVVVSWHALLTSNHEEIAKYQLYSYQEGRRPASTSLWKKLGDMEPMALPMACTLSQFSGGHTYHFAMRAVDIHGRCGRFSESLSMYMEEDKVAEELKVKKAAKAAAKAAAREAAREAERVQVSNSDANSKEMESVQGKEREGVVSDKMDTEENSSVQARDPVEMPIKEEEKLAECDKESEGSARQVKEQDMEVEQEKEQDKEKVQAKEQDIEMAQVKEEKDP